MIFALKCTNPQPSKECNLTANSEITTTIIYNYLDKTGYKDPNTYFNYDANHYEYKVDPPYSDQNYTDVNFSFEPSSGIFIVKVKNKIKYKFDKIIYSVEESEYFDRSNCTKEASYRHILKSNSRTIFTIDAFYSKSISDSSPSLNFSSPNFFPVGKKLEYSNNKMKPVKSKYYQKTQ